MGLITVPAPLGTGLVLIQPGCLLDPPSPNTPGQGSVPAQSPAVIAVQTLQPSPREPVSPEEPPEYNQHPGAGSQSGALWGSLFREL